MFSNLCLDGTPACMFDKYRNLFCFFISFGMLSYPKWKFIVVNLSECTSSNPSKVLQLSFKYLYTHYPNMARVFSYISFTLHQSFLYFICTLHQFIFASHNGPDVEWITLLIEFIFNLERGCLCYWYFAAITFPNPFFYPQTLLQEYVHDVEGTSGHWGDRVCSLGFRIFICIMNAALGIYFYNLIFLEWYWMVILGRVSDYNVRWGPASPILDVTMLPVLHAACVWLCCGYMAVTVDG